MLKFNIYNRSALKKTFPEASCKIVMFCFQTLKFLKVVSIRDIKVANIIFFHLIVIKT
jgi:hypothetical protein